MEIAMYQMENKLWICVPEELDQYAADIIRRKCEIIFMDQERKHIIFDFSKTTFMDSGGIGMILGRLRQQQAMGGLLFIYKPGKRMVHLIKISGLMRYVIICEREDQIDAKLEEMK